MSSTAPILELTIVNETSTDAVAALTLKNNPMLAVYIRARERFVISGIVKNTFHLYAVFGEDWDSGASKFTRVARYARHKDAITFEEQRGQFYPETGRLVLPGGYEYQLPPGIRLGPTSSMREYVYFGGSIDNTEDIASSEFPSLK